MVSAKVPAGVPAVVGVVPVRRSAPMTMGPGPTIVEPSPATAYPDVSWGGASRRDLNEWGWHRRWEDDRCRSDEDGRWSHHHRRGSWNSEADTESNASVCSGDPQSGQG